MGKQSNGLKHAALAGVATAIAGFVFDVFTGSGPSSPHDAKTGTLLATFQLENPALDSPSAGTRAALGVPISATGLADGVAGWGRVRATGDDGSADGTTDLVRFDVVKGSEFTLSNDNIKAGQTVRLTALVLGYTP